MSAVKFEFNRRSWAQVSSRIKRMVARARDVTPAWNVLIGWFAEQNLAQFKSHGGRYRTPWKPLSPVTVEEKRRSGYPSDPLVRSTRLFTSLTARPMGSEHLTPHEMAAGTSVAYAKFHQGGAPRAGLPARPLISAVQIRREQAVTSAVANWIVRGELRVGGRTVMRGGK